MGQSQPLNYRLRRSKSRLDHPLRPPNVDFGPLRAHHKREERMRYAGGQGRTLRTCATQGPHDSMPDHSLSAGKQKRRKFRLQPPRTASSRSEKQMTLRVGVAKIKCNPSMALTSRASIGSRLIPVLPSCDGPPWILCCAASRSARSASPASASGAARSAAARASPPCSLA